MKVLITGASGVVGRHLIKLGNILGWEISVFSYSGNSQLEKLGVKVYTWNPEGICVNNNISQDLCVAFSKSEYIINLSGETIGKGRLTTKLKQNVLNSRLNSTKALIRLAEKTNSYDKTWIQMSATGFYKTSVTGKLTENSPAGDLFLSKVCKEVERLFYDLVANKLKRAIVLRLGLVLASDATAWKKIVLPIKLGFGSGLGTGCQYWSWIHIDDVVNSIEFLMKNNSCNGVFNLTAPVPETQLNFTKKVAKAFNRPVFLPSVPAWLLRLIVGNAVNELVLPSHYVVPEKLQESGYEFKFSNLEEALAEII
jgi:uncharacterized protein